MVFILHLYCSSWRKGTMQFLRTQAIGLATYITFISQGADAITVVGLGLVFTLFFLVINIKFATDTDFVDPKYMMYSRFKEFCMEKGFLTEFEAFTLSGIRLLTVFWFLFLTFVCIKEWL